jgi:hypothetical protein
MPLYNARCHAPRLFVGIDLTKLGVIATLTLESVLLKPEVAEGRVTLDFLNGKISAADRAPRGCLHRLPLKTRDALFQIRKALRQADQGLPDRNPIQEGQDV